MSKLWSNDKIRLLRKHNLVAGDIILARASSESRIYIYDGENVRVLTDGSFKVSEPNKQLSYYPAYSYYYVILRPSYVME